MKKSIRKILILMGVMCIIFGLCALTACNGGDDATTTDATTEVVTEAPETTEADTSAESVVTTAAQTELATTDAASDSESVSETEAPSEVATESDTEPATEIETEDTTTEEITEGNTLPADAPTNPTSVTFCDIPENSSLITPASIAKFEIVDDAEKGSVLKVSVAKYKKNTTAYVKINYASYMKALGLEPAAWTDCAYALAEIKVDGIKSPTISMVSMGKVDGAAKTVTSTSSYGANGEWHYVLFPVAGEEGGDGMLGSLQLEFAENAQVGETLYVKSIVFYDNKPEAVHVMGTDLLKPQAATVVIPGLTKEYTFLQITDTHVSAFYDSEKGSWTATRLNYNLARRAAFVADGLYAEERFPLFFDYAETIGATGIFMTGDLVDFPSEKNLDILYDNVTRVNADTIFCLGNHDWNYSDDYMTSNAYATYKPLFAELNGGDPDFAVKEYDEFIVAAIDNSADMVTQETVDKFFALYAKNKPIILLLHVPLHADTLAPDVIAAWNRNITMGIGAMGEGWQSVRDLYTSVCLDENTPVVAVFAGHVHFNHVDTFPNGVTQYVTNAGYFGDCRVITVKGAN